jgi:hypothetical protein
VTEILSSLAYTGGASGRISAADTENDVAVTAASITAVIKVFFVFIVLNPPIS